MTLTLEQIDQDEALLESIAILHGETRAGFLRKAVLGSAGLVVALAQPAQAAVGVTDVDILNFGLRFERLQATFYTEADEVGTIHKMTARKQRWAEVLGAHERAHVRILKKILGDRRASARSSTSTASPRPTSGSHARLSPWRTSPWRCCRASRRACMTAS
jgi:hypothetical protein